VWAIEPCIRYGCPSVPSDSFSDVLSSSKWFSGLGSVTLLNAELYVLAIKKLTTGQKHFLFIRLYICPYWPEADLSFLSMCLFVL